MVQPAATKVQKYSKNGLVDMDIYKQKGIQSTAAKSLAIYANHGLSKSTWSSYKTVCNHIERCTTEKGQDISLPFNTGKILNFVAWLID